MRPFSSERLAEIEAGAVPGGREAQAIAAELRITRERLATARNDVLEQLRSTTAHVHENARSLARFGEGSKAEARCRELAALYLEEAEQICRMIDESQIMDAWSTRLHAFLERTRTMLAEVDAVEVMS